MSILALNDRDWKSLCEAMKMPELANDPLFATPALRLQNDSALYAIVRPAIAALPSALWSERLTGARLMHEQLNSYADFIDQPHVRETGLIQWLQQAGVTEKVPVPTLPGTPPQSDGTPRAIAPVPGQHSRGDPGRARLHGGGDLAPAVGGHGRPGMITLLTPAQYRRIPWKNGGGISTDIATDEATGGEVWRFGRTPIPLPGPFSDYSGYDRVQVLIKGRGLVLDGPEGEIDLRTPFEPVRYPARSRW